MNIVVTAERAATSSIFYPVSEDAHFLCELLNEKFLNKKHFMKIRKRGYHVEIVLKDACFKD